MDKFEREFKRVEGNVRRLCNIALFGKKLVVKGKENFIKEGPNIIIGNHVGAFKDIAALLKVVPRPVFFTANKMIFNRDEFSWLIRKHLKRHLKKFGLFVDLAITPIKTVLINFVSANITRVGTIPVDLYNRKRMAMKK